MNQLTILRNLLINHRVSFRRRLKALLEYRDRINSWRATEDWTVRVNEVIQCPDNSRIKRVAAAGQQVGQWIIMHNGLQISLDGYYGQGLTRILKENRGVHEPQEELVFDRIAGLLPERPTMLELGAYWGFYSMSLKQTRPDARCILLEGESNHLDVGRENFSKNDFSGEFLHAFIGDHDDGSGQIPTLSVDSILLSHKIARLDILHADIQGHEFKMLMGASQAIEKNLIDYIFISTHSNALHYKCRNLLSERNYRIVADVDLLDTYSFDGLLVAQRIGLTNLPDFKLSLRSRDSR